MNGAQALFALLAGLGIQSQTVEHEAVMTAEELAAQRATGRFSFAPARTLGAIWIRYCAKSA